MRIVVCKAEACTGALVLIVWDDRILQSARLTHDRHRTIAQTHQLGESARLKQRRHQECITGCIDLVGHRLGIINVRGYLARILPCKVTEHIFVFFFTGTKRNDLNIVLAHFVHHVGYEIEALLIRKA